MGAHDSRVGAAASHLRRAAACPSFTLAIVPHQSDPPATAAPNPLERWLLVLAAVAAWSIVPPYLGPLLGLELDVASSVEVVDHVLPGVSAIAAAVIARSEVRRGNDESVRLFAALGICVLAGLFQTVTHFTLVLDAGGPLQPVDSVLLHATPGPVLMGLALWLLLDPPSAARSRA